MKIIVSIFAFLLPYQSLFGQVIIKDTLAFDCISQSDTVDGQYVFQVVDKMPQYPGGTELLYKFISKNVKFTKAKT